MLATLLGTLLVANTATPATARIPYAKTEVGNLTNAALEHREVLRIRRDFGKSDYEIVLDSWVDRSRSDRLGDVRVWWAKTSESDRRSPFGKRVMRYLDLRYTPVKNDAWRVRMTGDRKEFNFEVVLEGRRPVAYATVVTDDGTRVEHCKAQKSTLVARRFIGIPVGIGKLAVTCRDPQGRTRKGEVEYRKVRRGKVYKP